MKQINYFQAWIGLGSNIGDKVKNCCIAVLQIAEIQQLKVTGLSGLYNTAPVGNTDQDRFVNGVIMVNTKLTSLQLMKHLLMIENNMGRKRTGKWGPRNIDLDLIMYADEINHGAELCLPHPRMHERLFVLKPLSDISPELIHSELKVDITELIESIDIKTGGIMPLGSEALPWEEIKERLK